MLNKLRSRANRASRELRGSGGDGNDSNDDDDKDAKRKSRPSSAYAKLVDEDTDEEDMNAPTWVRGARAQRRTTRSVENLTEEEIRHRQQLHFERTHKMFFCRRDAFLADPDSDDSKPNPELPIMKLRDPATQCINNYVCNAMSNIYYDVWRYSEPNRCWVLFDSMTIGGIVYFMKIIDPLFLVLPYLQKNCTDRFVPFDQALVDEDPRCADIARLRDTVPFNQVLLLCDQKGPADLRAVRYNEEKTLNWLAFKSDKYIRLMKHRNVAVKRGVRSETYVKSVRQPGDEEENQRLSLSISMLCDYLPKAMHAKLATRLGAVVAIQWVGALAAQPVRRGSASSTSSTHKRKPSEEVQPAAGSEKKAREKAGSSSSGGDSPATPSQKKESAKDKALAKAAAGTRGILSFFKKK